MLVIFQYPDLLQFFFFQAEDGIRDTSVTGVQTCALPISRACRTVGRVNMSSVTDAPDNLVSIQWQDQSEDFRQWLAARADIELRHLAPGVEAHTWALARGGRPENVLKVWNKGFTADAKEQHRFLFHARQAGLPVPRSVGWGRDEGGHQILATRFAGYPIDRP